MARGFYFNELTLVKSFALTLALSLGEREQDGAWFYFNELMLV